MNIDAIAALTDKDLCTVIVRFASDEQHATARLVAALGEVDRRRLFLAQGCASLFAYCTEVLHLGEGAAYTRIEAARAARRWPLIVDLLDDGSITLATVRLLAPHLTDDNHRVLLNAAIHKSKRAVEQQMAALSPLAEVPSVVRKVPTPRPPAESRRASKDMFEGPASSEHAILRAPEHRPETQVAVREPSPPAARRAAVVPLAAESFKVQFTIARESYDQLKHAQNLLRHVIPTGDVGAIFERALGLLVADLERKKLAQVKRPRVTDARPDSFSRYVSASVRREVWKRDGARCAFVGSAGRCTERGFLELHHVVPFADGGPATVDNLSLRCRAHNQYEAESVFGPIVAPETAANDWLNGFASS